jgi:hypothetical protein
MDDLWLKLRMLQKYGFSLREWWRDVWTRDASESMCCSGYECGCQGSCYGDWWEYLLSKEPKP